MRNKNKNNNNDNKTLLTEQNNILFSLKTVFLFLN